MGSGWEVETITIVYVNVAHYQPLRGGTYLPLPAKLAKKKAIINVQNKDNECLKWALRAPLFPTGKDLQRPSKYKKVKDGINYRGIDFPTPVGQIDKLEAQNRNLAINVFSGENNEVTIHRVGKKEANVLRINLMLIVSEEEEIQHYCYVKKVSALLFDQTKHQHSKHFCMMCLNHFTRADLLESHKKYCKGVNGTPTRIEMREEGKNILSFQNYHKQMEVPYMIYADSEALVRKIPGCERGPEGEQTSYTEKIEWHEACGYAYRVVRCDGEVTASKVYWGENAMGRFLSDILQEEVKIRESLATPKPIVMTWKDWEKFKNATDCYDCNKSLIKDKFLDSLPVYNIEKVCEEGSKEASEKWSYWGQGHQKCFYEVQKKIIRIVKSNDMDKITKLVASPLFSRHAILTNDLSGINM